MPFFQFSDAVFFKNENHNLVDGESLEALRYDVLGHDDVGFFFIL